MNPDNHPASTPIFAVLPTVRHPLPLFAAPVPAGFPSPATDHMDDRLDIVEYLSAHPESTFYFRVKGDSMTGAGIHNGDLLVVDRDAEPINGSVVIAAIDGEITVKRLRLVGGRAILQPENPAYTSIIVSDAQELQVWGVVSYVIHKP